jgi:threonine dehydratase
VPGLVGDVGETARLIIRPLGRDDADAVGAVHVRAWQAAYRGLLPDDYLTSLTVADRAAFWTRTLAHAPRQRGGARLGAEQGGRVVGFIVVGQASDDAASGTGEVHALNVDPSHWSSGIGHALLAAGVGHLRGSGFTDAILWVHPGNARARRFYEAAGWRHDHVDRQQEVLGVQTDETRYRRSLGDAPAGPPATVTATVSVSIDRAAIEKTERVIRPHVRFTPVLEVDGGDLGLAARSLTLKLELLQQSGSFKARGAFANLLLRTLPAAGVVAASGGNHGAAVAFAAKALGARARIYVPTVSSPAKIARIRSYGAHLVVVGDRYADALAASEEWGRESGALAVHAYDQIETLLGQGTLGLELERQAPGLDTVLVAVGGGGLIGGVAAWYASRVTVIGVEPETAPTLTEALKAGGPVDAPAGGIAADSLAPRRVGALMFPIARAHVARVVLVPDDAIAAAQRRLWDTTRIVAEPGGAAALAALLCGAYVPAPGERVGVVLSGGNTTAVDFGSG